MFKDIVIIKGAGDIASAVAHKLHRSGFRVVMTEIEKPTCLRRYVSFANCIYEGKWQVEGVTALKAENPREVFEIFELRAIAVIRDPQCHVKNIIKSGVLVDSILAKRNTGTLIGDAPLVIGLGPGFTAGQDVDMVVETNRGHNLGKVIISGKAEEDTGVPGSIGGYTKERVLRAPTSGEIGHIRRLGDIVEKDEVVAVIGNCQVKTPIAGVVRGLIHEGLSVPKGFKIGDVDPRGNQDWIYTISDKGRCIAGGVLEAIMMGQKQNRGEKK